MCCAKLTGNTKGQGILAVQETSRKMPPFGEAKNLREREMIEPVMPIHQLLLNRSESPWASKRFSLILGDPCAYLFTIVKRSLGEVTQISLEFETQIGVMNL